MNVITEWGREVFIMILTISFLEIMLPEGSMRKYVKFIFSIVIMAVILSPMINFLLK